MRRRPLTLLISLAIVSPVLAQSRSPVERGGPAQAGTLTRSAAKYRDLEIKLTQALREKSAGPLDQMLADDFEVRSAERADAMSRQDWQKSEFAAKVQPSRVQ